ncbi:hypothetical protein KJ969_04825 [Patescibacteria group bacterium]|nr:hypothetical protein [Patescibacteria group bacterium]MBU1921810.1 hypothetical protein [Patescibacteria group bacterium]
MNLGRLVNNLNKASRPENRFKKRLWRRLDRGFDQMYSVRPVFVFKKAAIFGVVVLMLLAVAGSAYAYESPQVIEGHPLYFLKQGLEGIEGKAKFTPEQKAGWHLKMQARRVKEGEFFANKKGDLREQLFLEGAAQMGKGIEEMRLIRSMEIKMDMVNRLSEAQKMQIQIMQNIRPKLLPDSQQAVGEIINEQNIGLKQHLEMLEQLEQEELAPILMWRKQLLEDASASFMFYE